MYELFITVRGTHIAGHIGQTYPHETRESAYADLGKRFSDAMLRAQGNPNLNIELLDTNIVAGFTSTLLTGGDSWLTITYEVCAV